MQQRTISAQPAVNTSTHTPSGTAVVVNDSSVNDFSKTLESALGVDTPLESVSNTTLPSDSQAVLNGMISQQGPQDIGPQDIEIERQDMPVANGLLPSIMPPPAGSGSLRDAMFLLKSKGSGTNENSSLVPILSPSSSTPVTTLNTHGTSGFLPVVDVGSHFLPNKMSVGIFENLGQKTTESGLLSVMTLSPNDNISSTSAIFNTQPSTVSNSSALASSSVINTPLGANGWGQELSSRVQWLVTQGIQAAALHINPPHLGPVEVRIVMDQNQASISFSAPHMMTREALEASIPRLRDMLSDNGLSLVNVNVSSNSFSDQREQQSGSTEIPQIFSDMDNIFDDESTLKTPSQAINHLVDYYA